MKVKEMRNKKEYRTQEMIRSGYFLNTVVILCLGVLIGFFALCLVHLIPVERMYDNAQVAQDMISEENTTYSVYGIKSTELDNYTDSIMVSTAICPKESSILEKVVYNYHSSYFKGYSEQENLRRYLVGEEGYDYSFYSHYWNGYLLFLKPLLFLFEYNDILMFNFMAQMLLVIWVIVGMVKKKKDFLILPFIITMLSMGVPTATSLSIQLSDVLYVTLLGTGMIVWNYQKLDNRSIYFLFLILGMMTSYFDFLTYPLVSLGIPLIVFISHKNLLKPMENVFGAIINSVGWAIGYVGMWMSKGIIGSLLFPDSQALETGIGHFFMRSSGEVGAEKVSFLDVVMKNVFTYMNWPVLVVVIVTALVLGAGIIIKGKMERKMIMRIMPYLVVLIYPFAWLFIMKNHSYQHAYMVYRILGIAVFAGLSALACLTQKIDNERQLLEC